MKLYLPLFLLVPILVLFYLIALPFLLIADVVFIFRRKPLLFTRSGLVLIELAWAFRGLTIDVQGYNQNVFIKVF